MNYAVIMAGGTGKRLWPLSREKRPKQVLKLIEDQTLLRKCFDRLTPIFDQKNILVLTNAGYADTIRENLPEVPYGNVIAEPTVRDTAGAIGLAASVLTKFDADATMAVVTADQLIEPAETLQSAISDALCYVNNNPQSFLTFGIAPTFPSTQLGYIKLGKSADDCDKCNNQISAVESFVEKPNLETAQQYVQSEQYCWNSGMFVWKAKTVLNAITSNLPEAVEPLKKIQASWDSPQQEEVLNQQFMKLPKISIDYAVMEKAKSVYAIKLDCKWIDMGSFAALADIINSDENNNIVVAGNSQLLDSKNNIIVTEDKDHMLAVIGLENMVVAHTPDATLVCSLNDTQRLKELLELIKKNDGQKYL